MQLKEAATEAVAKAAATAVAEAAATAAAFARRASEAEELLRKQQQQQLEDIAEFEAMCAEPDTIRTMQRSAQKAVARAALPQAGAQHLLA